ncbi:putative secreted protein [Salmonella enterica subsp. enterica]|nr:putative secreted protein [Salmonella enterica subsp. enterica] [Salmonella enterica subsp. enterica serovar Menston]
MTLSDAEGLVRINGELVTSQKVKYLGAQGDESKAVWNMGLMPARDGNNYGFEFVKRNGKSFLNVQLLQNSMDAPKIIGSFPCKKVQD